MWHGGETSRTWRVQGRLNQNRGAARVATSVRAGGRHRTSVAPPLSPLLLHRMALPPSFPGAPISDPPVDAPAQQHKGKAKDVAPESCVICLDAISERAVTVPCNHYSFDFLCLVSWLQECSSCPLCKTDVSQVQYDWRSPDDFKTYSVQSTKLVTASSPAPSAPSATHPRPRHFVPRRSRYGRPARRSPSPSPDLALIRRRYVYRHELFSMHVGTNRISRYANFTPQNVASSPDLQSRARAFIRRELRVFSFLHPDTAEDSESASRRVGNAEFLLEYIIAILKKVDIKGPTGKAEDMLQEFIGRSNARLFLHELGAWLRSPYTRLEDWDRHVQYREPLPATAENAESRRVASADVKPSDHGHPGPSRSHSHASSHRSSPYQRGDRSLQPERSRSRRGAG